LQKLTDNSLKSTIQRTTGSSDITDPSCKGLQLRVTPEARTWYFRYTWHGSRVRATLGSYPSLGLADARAAAITARGHLKRGIDPRNAGLAPTRTAPPAATSTGTLKPYSVEALVDEFMRLYITPNRKRPEEIRRMLHKDVLTVWKGRDARTITSRQVIELLDGIVARGRPVMANRMANLLEQLFKFGIHRSIVENNPVQLLIPPGGKEKSRTRCLTDSELKALIDNRKDVFKSHPIHHALMLLLLTMQRRGELVMTKWSHLDLDAGIWNIPAENAKTEAAISIPLSPWAIEEFKAQKQHAGRSAWVFPDTDGETHFDPKLITRSIARCQKRLKRLGVEKFTGHDLRRTGRTGLARLNIPQHIAERCLNHAVGSAIERAYNVHDYFDERREALNKWAAHLESRLS
jgi:integrase